MEDKVKEFAKKFQEFITGKTMHPGEVRLSKNGAKWGLEYIENGKVESQEFTTPVFLSVCPFYPAMTVMLNSLEERIDCENFLLDIFMLPGGSFSWKVNTLEKTKSYDEELCL